MKRTQAELAAIVLPMQYEKAVDLYITCVVRTQGYDTVDSIAKYMARSTSPFYAECVALGDWIDACWMKCHELLNAGQPITIEELLALLPKYGG